MKLSSLLSVSFVTPVLPGQSPESRAVTTGTSFDLTCTFEAGSEIRIEWLKDGDLLSGRGTTTPPESFTYTGVLNLAEVSFLDCGKYSCSVGGVMSEPAAELSVVGESGKRT